MTISIFSIKLIALDMKQNYFDLKGSPMLVLMRRVMLAIAWMRKASALSLRRNARVWQIRSTRLRFVRIHNFPWSKLRI